MLFPALLLAACQPAKPPPAATPGPPPAISRFGEPLTARGNEPFWAVSIAGKRLTLTRPDHPPVSGEASLKLLSDGWAQWEATMADGRVLTLALVTIECSDGMSDHRYPMGAEVTFDGQVLKGCAAKTPELPKGG